MDKRKGKNYILLGINAGVYIDFILQECIQRDETQLNKTV